MADTRRDIRMILALMNLLPFNFAAAVGTACTPKGGTFFGLPHWWQYIPSKVDELGQCSPVVVFPGDLLAIALAITNMLLWIAGLAAVISIVIAGVGFITAAGSTDKITASRKRIQNALIGLGIVLIASALVSFIGNSLN
ncbi:pilin [Candidatus Saccharibacteria bacterium]|nr:pilin [Candidatus Saccharibacteria bacterium]